MSTFILPVVTPSPDLISDLLNDQQQLTAVEKFSALHEQSDHNARTHDADTSPAQAKYYRSLLPATPPSPGEQYAFEVDLDQCSGCKACVVACHTMNGLEDDESWRRVGTLTIGGDEPAVQHVTTACHHCEDPGCLNGCPVKAYDKDPVTGIVRHLDDQCIGCKYCTMMCPYEVPQYSDRLGIVRKCDMCHQRLSVGEAPACVQACPNEAIKITKVASTASIDTDHRLAPGAPLSTITKPTTRYGSSHQPSIAASTPQDFEIDKVAESHWPLAVMLVATQASVGMLAVERIASILFGSMIAIETTRWTATISLLIGIIGLNIASLHLGQPLRAWRVFLGLRTSWLSREAVVLGKYVGLLTLSTALLWLPAVASFLPEWLTESIPEWAASVLLTLTVLVGAAGLFSSAMIYIVTKRQVWRPSRTLSRFFGTTIVSGIAALAAIVAFTSGTNTIVFSISLLGSLLGLAKIGWEWMVHLNPNGGGDAYDQRSRRLVAAKLSDLSKLRMITGFTGVALLLVAGFTAFASPTLAGTIATAGGFLILVGELAERWLYFSSVVYDRMPGTL